MTTNEKKTDRFSNRLFSFQRFLYNILSFPLCICGSTISRSQKRWSNTNKKQRKKKRVPHITVLLLILPLLFLRISFLFVEAAAAATVVVFLLFFFESFGALSALNQCKFCAKAKHFYARVFITHTSKARHVYTYTIGVLSKRIFYVATTIHVVHGMAIFIIFFSFPSLHFFRAIGVCLLVRSNIHSHSSRDRELNKSLHFLTFALVFRCVDKRVQCWLCHQKTLTRSSLMPKCAHTERGHHALQRDQRESLSLCLTM